MARVRGGETIESDDYVRCRIYSHAWDEFFPDDMEVPSFGWRLSLRCTRCTTERHDVIDRKGAVAMRRYIYPEGYSYATGERPDRSYFRDALFDRLRVRLAQSQAVAKDMARRAAGNGKGG